MKSNETNFLDKYSYTSKESSISQYSLKLKQNQQDLLNHIKEQDFSKYEYLSVCYRKLREGLFSSAMYDDFIVQVYEESVDNCFNALLNSNINLHIYRSELIKCLAILINDIYPSFKGTEKEREMEMLKYYLLLQICNNVGGINTVEKADFQKKLKLIKHRKHSKEFEICFQLKRFLKDYEIDYFNFEKVYNHCDNEKEKYFLTEILVDYRKKTFSILQKSYITLHIEFLRKYLLFYSSDYCELKSFLKEELIEIDIESRINGNIVKIRKKI